jgi:hypothetical protein
MRNTMLLSFGLVAAACSADHVTVATLDPPDTMSSAGVGGTAGASATGGDSARPQDTGGAGSGGDSFTFAGKSTTSVSTGGAITSSSGPEALGGGALNTAGSVDDGGEVAGAGNFTGQLVCTCLGQSSSVCGSDGNTYDANCGAGDDCLPTEIACWHECPCLVGESDSMAMTAWFPRACAPPGGCGGDVGFVCSVYSNTQDTEVICGTGN